MMTENGEFEIVARTVLETKPVVYGSTSIPGRQDYALTGYKYEEQYTGLVEKYNENITKLRIVKKEYNTDKVLPGVKFNLLNENKEIILENQITDGNGEIVLKNMFPGKYFIEEVETLEGYVLYTDLIEVNLDFNEGFEVIVNNKIKEVTEVVKDFESIEVTGNKTETIIREEVEENIIQKNEEIIESIETIEKNIDIKNNKVIKKLPVTGC